MGAWLAGVCAGLTGCAVGPDYRVLEPDVPHVFVAAAARPIPPGDLAGPGGPAGPGELGEPSEPRESGEPGGIVGHTARDTTAPQPAVAIDLTQWWRSLNDAELDSLIDRAVKANPDIDIALTRLQEARTQEAAHLSALLPSIAGSAAGGHGTGSDLTRAGAAPGLREGDNKGSLDQIAQVAGFSASWELDLFGGYRRQIEAGRYDVGAAAAARDVVLISVIGDVARNYVDMRGLQARLAITRDNIATAAQSRDLEQERFDRGLTNELDLQLATRELATLRAELPVLRSDISSIQYNIAVLLGQYPEELATELAQPADLPGVPASVETGLPLELLRRRPDIREAERTWLPLPRASGSRPPTCFRTWHSPVAWARNRTPWVSRVATSGPSVLPCTGPCWISAPWTRRSASPTCRLMRN